MVIPRCPAPHTHPPLQPGQHVSSVFTRPGKKDGSHRMILNLKELNKSIAYHHFRMEALQVALKLNHTKLLYGLSRSQGRVLHCPNCTASQESSVFVFVFLFLFLWRGQFWQYDCMPNGLAFAPRKFAKLIKPVFAKMREEGHVSTFFVEDSLSVSESERASILNVQATVQLFRSLGFITHPDKSIWKPTQQIQYLGVISDSKSMTVRLTDDRKDNLRECRVKS